MIHAQPAQRECVLRLLSDGRWHSTIEFVEQGILRVSARVYELRRRGFLIDVQRGARRGRSTTYVYRLVQAPTVGAQRSEPAARAEGDVPADAQLEFDDELHGPRPSETVDVALPSLEERRRIAAEARAAFALATRKVAS